LKTSAWPYLIGALGVAIMLAMGAAILLGLTVSPWFLIGIPAFGVLFLAGLLLFVLAVALARR
jgi:hypothetical protein